MEKKLLPFVLIFLFALGYGVWTMGWDVLNPKSLWLVLNGNDPTCHHLASVFFRNEGWHFPLGRIETQNIAQTTSIGLTDSIPLVALSLKLFGISGNFQYLGLWQLFCLILMGIFGVLWAQKWTPSPLLQVLAATFLVASPLVLFRMSVHAALCAQWLVLAGLWLYQKPWRTMPWAFLVALAALIHPYFLAMLLGFAFFKTFYSKKYLPFLFLLALAAILIYAAGYLEGDSLQAGGFGHPRARPYSFFLPWLHEYSLFLGLGILALAALLLFKRPKNIAFLNAESKGLLPCVFLMLLFAFLTPRFARLWLVGDIFQMFRANVRFGWPFAYLAMLFVVAGIIQSFPKKTAALLLAAALFWQLSPLHPFGDIYGQFRHMMAERRANSPEALSTLEPFARNNNTLLLLSQKMADEYYDYVFAATPFARYAAENKLRSNFLCQGHPDVDAALQFQKEIFEKLQKGVRAPNTFYVFLNDYEPNFLKENLPEHLKNEIIFFENYSVLPALKN